METTKKTWDKKRIGIIAAIVACLCILAIEAIVVVGSNGDRKLNAQLKLADRYLDELDYEAAIAAYEAAIEIEPRCEAAYLGMAEAYKALGEYEKALETLETGYDATGSEKIQEALDELKAYLEEQNADHVMVWNDPNLEAAMHEVTGITDRDIMLSDVKGINRLDLAEKGISNIEALGELKNLKDLYLSDNSISNVSSLSSLTKLQVLWLDGNDISDIGPLSDLK